MIHTHFIDFKDFGGTLGHLTPIEATRDVPFEIKRVYYITRVPQDVIRGFHSHRALEQVLICVNGSVKIRLKTPFDEEVMELNDPAKGLYIGHMIWREMFDFSPGASLVVLASDYYNEADYLRDYQSYEKEAVDYFEEAYKE